MAIVAPSVLSADFSHIEEEVLKMEKAGATYLHLDVMDGLFVPNKTFGPDLVERIHGIHHMVNDVHLMVEAVEEHILSFAKAGADSITFHIEACKDEEEAHRFISLIHSLGLKAGISLKPNTPAEALFPFFEDADMILVMSVEPGKGGQKYLSSASEKLSLYREKLSQNPRGLLLEVDGGINAETAPIAVNAGAEILVAGSYLYGHENYEERVRGLLAL